MSRKNTPITDEVAEYIRQVGLREPEVLRRRREETESFPHASMQISPEQGQFLQFITRLMGARKTLEVGVFLGYSSTWVALGLPEDGRILACDVSEEYTAEARRTWQAAGVADKIELRLGPAIATLDGLIAAGETGTYDFGFIDADKSNYSNYYERALVLVRQGGLIAVDNVLWHGRLADASPGDVDTEALRVFNRRLHADERVALTMVTIGDGLTLACKL